MELKNKLTEAPIQIPIVDEEGYLADGWAQQMSQLFDAVKEIQEIIEREL